MRTYYIFKIKKHYANLTNTKPYHIYKTIEDMYYLSSKELLSPNNLFLQMYDRFNDNILNNIIYDEYKDLYTYTKYNNIHQINDYFTNEQTKMIINKSYILIKTTKQIPSFFNILSKRKDIFVCDFLNKDYFWLANI